MAFRESVQRKKNEKGTQEFQQAKSKSFIDIFYNYFTETANEQDKELKGRSSAN
eukprot:CAMPEP_0202967350 /NCGR_PEP_ID=MMETSP1396-20130829/12185_1 /ASSEMBLY_ACC=CAM_ASM_000872 /TAXON_ID= /ORGANISM="Pseudokeronopsis sp., Strain Brazil" /LENGTH=53 /DNA_ID=CAMNT_0049692301 /DNA_START=396 /DNA_END=557 /DNA_ORIENTATION=+